MSAQTVAWLSDQEWAQVYEKNFNGSKDDMKHALEIMKVWRLRFAGKTPVAIETTHTLLEAILSDQSESSGLRQQHLSAAVLQFVGLIAAPLMDKDSEMRMYAIGEYLGMPEWLVDLRHCIAHNPFPSLAVLEKAADFCFDWLKINHWDKQAVLNDYCNLPLMVLSDDFGTLDHEISLILLDFTQSHSKEDRIEMKKNLSAFNSPFELQRFCVVFVLKKYYYHDWNITSYNSENFDEQELPLKIVKLWDPLVQWIAKSNHLPILLYSFVFNLCCEENPLNKFMLSLWTKHILQFFNNSQRRSMLNKGPLINECIKLLLVSDDIYMKNLFDQILDIKKEQLPEKQINKLFMLKSVSSASSKQDKAFQNSSAIYTLDDVLNLDQSKDQDPTPMWSLYNGESLIDCPIGLLPNQNPNFLSKQLYNFSELRVSAHAYNHQDSSKCFEHFGDYYDEDNNNEMLEKSSIMDDVSAAETSIMNDSHLNNESMEEVENTNVSCLENFNEHDWEIFSSSLETF